MNKIIICLIALCIGSIGCISTSTKYTSVPNEVYIDMLAKSKAWDTAQSAPDAMAKVKAFGIDPILFYQEMTREALEPERQERWCRSHNYTTH